MIIFLFIIGDRSYSKERVVAVILASNLEKFKIAYNELQRTLQEHKKDSYVQIVLSTPNPDPASWANALKRAEGMEVDLIIAFGAPLAYTALKERISVPLLYVDVYEKGILDAFKSKQMTGIYNVIPITTVLKNLLALKSFKTLHVLYCPLEKESEIQAGKIKELAEYEGIKVSLHPLKSAQSVYDISINNTDAIFLTSSVILEMGANKIAQFAIEKEVPLVGVSETVTNAGGLMCVAPDAKIQGRLISNFLLNYIEKGILTKSEQIKEVNFILNMKTAKRINITIPFTVLNNVTKVIK
ncbi:MAG: hypothetical protein N2202_00300 [Proteobacteria bacterium]|nr:hypothetical protein [Pseudomonadota bacterium]